jgi:hypothetical protein
MTDALGTPLMAIKCCKAYNLATPMLKNGKRAVPSSNRERYKSFPILFVKTISFSYICTKTIIDDTSN